MRKGQGRRPLLDARGLQALNTASLISMIEWMNEWMMHLYSALCIVVHPHCFTIMWGGLSSTTTSVQHPLGWCDGCHRTTTPVRSPHTSYRWRGESHRANQVDSVIDITKWEYFQKPLSVNTIRRTICSCRLKLCHAKRKPYVIMVQKRCCVLWAKANLKLTVSKWKVFYGQTSPN